MSRVRAAVVGVMTCACVLVPAGCGSSGASGGRRATERTPAPPPTVTLSEEEKQVWSPLPPDRSKIPVLLYHGIGPPSDFSNSVDASYGIDPYDFAKQMTLIRHAGFQTVDLQTFLRFVEGESVELPPRPFLLTFDDARADSWTGADGILKELGFRAVMFVDVGRVADRDPEYLTWHQLQKMQRSGRWELQLHSGYGHMLIQWGPKPEDVGPFYAYEKQGESFDGWKQRTFSDIDWGGKQLARNIRGYRPKAIAPPYGNYGQDGTNDPNIPHTLLPWLTQHYQLVFTQDRNWFAKPGASQPLGRYQVTRATSGGDVHAALVGEH
jgi:hypothetical protein